MSAANEKRQEQTLSAAPRNAQSQTLSKPNPMAASIRGTMGRGGGGRGGHGMHSTDKPKDFKGTMHKLLRFARPYAPRIIAVAAFAVLSTVFAVVGPLIMGKATTELFEGSLAALRGTGGIDFAAIGTILTITLALYAVSAFSSFMQSWIMAGVTQRIAFDLRESISKKFNRLPFSFYEKNTVGDIMSRITNDADTLGQNLSSSVIQIITTVFTVVGILAMMLSVNLTMTLIVLAVAPLGGACAALIVKLSQKHFFVQQRTLGQVNALVEETFSGYAEVKAFCHEASSQERFEGENERLYHAAWKSQFLSSFMKPIMDIVGNIGYVVVAVVGAVLASGGIITVGHIQAFIQYERNFMQPVSSLAQIANVLQQMAAAAERVFELLDAEEEDAPAGASAGAPAASAVSETPEANVTLAGGDIEFSHVQFGYDPERPVIKDFTTRVKAGQTVAIVGPTGAGKTTLVKLLMRFYDPQAGSITIGGQDIRSLPRAEVRKHFGMVLQDAWLFSGTVAENIRYGRLDATKREVGAAARAAKSHHFIKTLPGGYGFAIGEDGGNISQGQRQLLTIARAILAERDMLILDEATSSVDTRTESQIQEAMDNLMAGRTCFVIAHRLSTIRNADMILVMKDGDIIEQGTHDELLARGGFYADLYSAQFEQG